MSLGGGGVMVRVWGGESERACESELRKQKTKRKNGRKQCAGKDVRPTERKWRRMNEKE